MKSITLTMNTIPKVARRGNHVVIGIFNPNLTQLYLSTKQVYPQGIYRLFGGGIESGEDTLVAASRELAEETGIKVELTDLIHLDNLNFTLIADDKSEVEFRQSVYAVITDKLIEPGDDVDEVLGFDLVSAENMVERYRSLSGKLTSDEGYGNFEWNDWGKLFLPSLETIVSWWRLELADFGANKLN